MKKPKMPTIQARDSACARCAPVTRTPSIEFAEVIVFPRHRYRAQGQRHELTR